MILLGGREPVAVEVPTQSPAAGCAFHPRCPYANDRFRRERPSLLAAGGAPDRVSRAVRRATAETTPLRARCHSLGRSLRGIWQLAAEGFYRPSSRVRYQRENRFLQTAVDPRIRVDHLAHPNQPRRTSARSPRVSERRLAVIRNAAISKASRIARSSEDFRVDLALRGCRRIGQVMLANLLRPIPSASSSSGYCRSREKGFPPAVPLVA